MEKNKFRDVPKFNNIKEILYNSQKLYGNEIAFTIKDSVNNGVSYKDITYTQLLDDVNCFGTALYNIGMREKRIAIFGRNRYEWVIAHLANLLGDMVSVPLDKELKQEELESSLIRSEAEVLVFDEKYIDLIESVSKNKDLKIKKYICMAKLDNYDNVLDLVSLGKQLLNDGYTEYIDKKISPNKMAVLLFTSGTTERSKAVMLSQYGISTNIYDIQLVESFYKTDVNIALLPFHHIFGSTCIILMLAYGVRTVFCDGLKYLKKNLKEYGVSVFVGVPILVAKIYENIEKEVKKQGKYNTFKSALKLSNILNKLHIDLRRKIFKSVIDELGGKLRFVISGGAPLDPEIYDKFNNLGIHIVQGYGLTETSPVIAAENDKYSKRGTVGIPMKNVDVRIENKDVDGIGQIVVKGPSVMLGYYKDEAKTQEVLKDGWFNTGDLGYIDKSGFLFITGRKKDMIVLKNGKKIFPEELESLINKLEVVKESFVYAMPSKDEQDDFKLSAKIVYDVDKVKDKYPDVSNDKLYEIIWDMIKKINETLPNYKHIKSIIITDKELIKTTTIKIKRNEELKQIIDSKV